MRLTLPWTLQRRLDDFFDAPWEQDDILPFGANIKTKGDNSVRFAVHNTNGTKLGSIYSGLEEIDAMDELGINILGLCETNNNWNTDSQLKLATLLNMKFGTGQTVTSSAPSDDRIYLPGGTATMARGKIAGRVVKRIPDSLGRYSYMTFRGKDNTGIIVITIYRVSQNRGTRTGPDTAYMQQYEALRAAGTATPDPRNQLLDDLTVLISEWREKGYKPVVMGDFNADMTDPRFADFVNGNALIDVVDKVNEGEPPRTYARGRKRLDYILADRTLLKAVVKAGSLGLHDGILSDHTMQWVDFDISALFQGELHNPTHPCERQFTLTQTRKKE